MKVYPRRFTTTTKSRVGGRSMFVSIEWDDDGRPCGLWASSVKQGQELQMIVLALMATASRAVRAGVPVESILKDWEHAGGVARELATGIREALAP